MLGPIPRWFPLVHLPVSSQGTTAFTTPRVARHTTKSSYGNFSTRGFSGLQSFRNVQASSFARHPGCSHRDLPAFAGTPGSRGFYFHAYLGLLPPRAVNMLAVRIRATDGMGTFTPQDSRPCRPLPRRCHDISTIHWDGLRPLAEPDMVRYTIRLPA